MSTGMDGRLEVRCCCRSENLIGTLPSDSRRLTRRELQDGTFAFSSEDKPLAEIFSMPGFVRNMDPATTGRKPWKKTWKK